MTRLDLNTTRRTEMLDVTDRVRAALRAAGVREGVCHLFVPHTTAAVTINENADPTVVHDVLHVLDSVVPFTDPAYGHLEGNSAAHVKAILVGCSETVPVADGQLVLGHWQGIFFCEFDGPRRRQLLLRVVGEGPHH